jgi:hypothetical protein
MEGHEMMQYLVPTRRLLCTAAATLILSTLMASSQEKVTQVTLEDIRSMKFCEFLLIFDDHVDIYNTSNANGCPEDKWQALDPLAIASSHGAKAAQLNGPHFWAMDEQIIGLGELKTFGGIQASFAASLPLSALGSGKGADPYKPYVSNKLQTMTFKAGSPVYELVDPDGKTYVLNAYGSEVEGGDPADLADQLSLPDGWSFQVTTPAQNLTIKGTSETPVNMVGDDMHQYYTRVD